LCSPEEAELENPQSVIRTLRKQKRIAAQTIEKLTQEVERIDAPWPWRPASPYLLEPLGQGLALDALHDEITDSVLAADIVENANVRMIEAGNSLGFAFKPLLLNRISGKLRKEES
jgi:hypothetical protein